MTQSGNHTKFAPSPTTYVIGSLIWALIAAASAVLSMWRLGWQSPQSYLVPCLFFAASAACAFSPALIIARIMSAGRGREAAFAATFVSLATVTLAFTALAFAIHYRIYYAQWHAEPYSVRWMYQLAFTGLASIFQFAVLGMRYFIPLGLPTLFVVSFWHSIRSR